MALDEFQEAVSRLAGSQEAKRAQRLQTHVHVIPDNPSSRVLNLRNTKSVGDRDKIIFGTADKIGARILTSDKKFFKGASAQGVDFDPTPFFHDPFSFMGQ
jgi:hypothetical protein